MKRKNKIAQPGDLEFENRQGNLFSAVSLHGDDYQLPDYPKVYRDLEGFKKVVVEAGDLLGFDTEFSPSTLKPTVIGVANYREAAAVWYSKDILLWMEDRRKIQNFKYSGHAVLTADRQVLEKVIGYETNLADWSDSMLTFWSNNSDLTKNPGKDDDGEGGLGFMGLGTMASLTTDLPNHKNCRGRNCEELICPYHDCRGYCAIDAYTGLIGDKVSRAALKERGVPEKTIDELHALQELTVRMQQLGIVVDREYIKKLDKILEEEQEKLFPAEGEEGYLFNPRSPKELTGWFKDQGIYLGAADKETVKAVLEREAAKEGYEDPDGKFEAVYEQLLQDKESLSLPLKALLNLYTYKVLGKGTAPWFADRYFGKDGKLHPRFVVTGTSTGRLSSSSPNFQNCSKRGYGKKLRKAVIPHNPENIFVEMDFSQMELRDVLYLAGVDPSTAGADAFSWLVREGKGAFEAAGQKFGLKPRDLAKVASHSSNYLIGFRLLSEQELTYARTKSEYNAGALRIYHPDFMESLESPWIFQGKVVSFTGSKLAQQLFKDKSFESRKKALEIQEDIYFKTFPMIREWQRRELTKWGELGYVMSPAHRFLRLNDLPEKNGKLIVAFLGQGVGASHAQAMMLRFYREKGIVFNSHIHDSFVFEWKPNFGEIWGLKEFMEGETSLLPGFKCPAVPEVGVNWGQMKELKYENGLYLLEWADPRDPLGKTKCKGEATLETLKADFI